MALTRAQELAQTALAGLDYGGDWMPDTRVRGDARQAVNDLKALAEAGERAREALRRLLDSTDSTNWTPGVNPDGSVSTETMARCLSRAALGEGS